MKENAQTLVIGFGNPGRLDDGLGPALTAKLELAPLAGVETDAQYQLCVEDAERISRFERVVFADADTACTAPFSFRRLLPAPTGIGFSSHAVEPDEVLTLARDLFGAEPKAYMLGIRGYEFNAFGEKLSPKAKENLEKAVCFLARVIREETIDQAALPPLPLKKIELAERSN